MRALGAVGHWTVRIIGVIAKTIGGLDGRHTFDQDNATSMYERRRDHRP